MHMLTIAFGGMGMAWKFGFKTAEAAEKAYTAACGPDGAMVFGPHGTSPAPGTFFVIQDDFGQRGRFSPAHVTGMLMENLDEVKILHVEHSLHEARTRATVQQQALSDPMLKFATANGPGGPPMITPMMRS